MESKYKKLEMLFCWSEFYSNSKNLQVPTLQRLDKVEKLKEEINKLRKQLID